MDSRGSSIDAGPSTRLLDTPVDGARSPSMVYQPPGRTASHAEQKSHLGTRDKKLAPNPIVLLSRVPVICMTFASIIIQFTGHPRAPPHVGLLVLTWITFFYSIWALAHHHFAGNNSQPAESSFAKLPEFGCIIGGSKYVCCGTPSPGDDDDVERLGREPRKVIGISLLDCLDVVLAFLLLLFGVLARTMPEWWRNRDYNMAWHPAFTLTCVVAGFLLGAVLVRRFRVTVSIGSWLDEENQAGTRIRLP